MSETSENVESRSITLTDFQRAKIERNRQRAVLLRESRLARRQWDAIKKEGATVKRTLDSGAGFLIEDEDEQKPSAKLKIVEEVAGRLKAADQPGLYCDDCGKEFVDSYLYKTYNADVCDQCRDTEEKHRLITRTDAKNRYLLNDADIDKREPKLKFTLKKNPHNKRWGEMKLYLEIQIAERAFEVWGSEEAIEEEKEKRLQKKEDAKKKKFDKKLTELKKAARSSLYRKIDTTHQHEFGEEVYNEETDEYTKSCYFFYLKHKIVKEDYLKKFCTSYYSNLSYEPYLETDCLKINSCFRQFNTKVDSTLKNECLLLISNRKTKECEATSSVCLGSILNSSSLNIALPDESKNPCFVKRLQDVGEEIRQDIQFRGLLNADFLWPFSLENGAKYCLKIIGWRTFTEAFGECMANGLRLLRLSIGDHQDESDSLEIIEYLSKSFDLDHNTFIWSETDQDYTFRDTLNPQWRSPQTDNQYTNDTVR
ncbi:DgyrCDS6407 [Dimorphilus gyrociliatus]|uniref:DgyrCDS6407 n=1 Tax=Dimorphilus gyrociliatus TaxID=2664684 RepID=A0A7I8VPJ1_9ANNE|nr:DgyrCDS6407 [Dimorphilus gyrociliatus]